MKQSIAVLGLGKYGMSLAKSLYDMGADVLVADRNKSVLEDMENHCSACIQADLCDEEEVLGLGLKNMDVVVTAMGGNLAASIMCVSVAKDLGVPLIIAKSSSTRMGKILEKVGATKVIDPEEQGGVRSARILASETVLDYFQIDRSLCMIEMKTQPKWEGKNLIELDLRRKRKINVVAVKEPNGTWQLADPEKPLKESYKLLAILARDDLSRFSDMPDPLAWKG